MNVELLKEVRKQILAEPSRLDMSDWVSESEYSNCGTTGCIAGWACCLVKMKKDKLSFEEVSNWMTGEQLNLRGRRDLELTPEQSELLFYVSHWPDDLDRRYSDVERALFCTDGRHKAQRKKLQCERARITAERIMRFIESGGTV